MTTNYVISMQSTEAENGTWQTACVVSGLANQAQAGAAESYLQSLLCGPQIGEADSGQNQDSLPVITWPSAAICDVAAERRRQIEVEGYDPTHDDEHVNDEIAAMAAYFAMPDAARQWDASSTGYGDTLGQAMIPHAWYMPSACDRRRELIKAGALILAEIERIDRAKPDFHPV